MSYFINVIGCDGVSEDDVHSEEAKDYIECNDCLNEYNDLDCKSYRIDLELNIVFG